VVDRSIGSLFFWIGVSLGLGDPRDNATWKSLDLGSHTGDFLKRAIVSEATSLQPKSRKGKLAFFSSVLSEGGSEFELINSYLHDTGIPLSECIKEGLRVEKFTEVDSILEERFGLGALDPLDESRSLFVGHTNPSCGVLRAFPLFLPGGGDCVSHQLGGFSLSLGSKHFSSL